MPILGLGGGENLITETLEVIGGDTRNIDAAQNQHRLSVLLIFVRIDSILFTLIIKLPDIDYRVYR